MLINSLKKYYKYDLISCLMFSLILLYYLIFSDQTKSVDLLTQKIIFLHYFINPIKIFFYLFLLPIITFFNLTINNTNPLTTTNSTTNSTNNSTNITEENICRKFAAPKVATSTSGPNTVTQKNSNEIAAVTNFGESDTFPLVTNFGESDINSIVRDMGNEIWDYKKILKYELREKLKILIKFNGILVFLSIILTTNNSINYLLNYIFSSFLYTCISLGTIIHFLFLPKFSITVSGTTETSGTTSTNGTGTTESKVVPGTNTNNTTNTSTFVPGTNSTTNTTTANTIVPGPTTSTLTTKVAAAKGITEPSGTRFESQSSNPNTTNNSTKGEDTNGEDIKGITSGDTEVAPLGAVGPDTVTVTVMEKLIIIKFIMLLIGNCFGNYLLLLDWYQLFARFPITNFIGLTIGHFSSSLLSNFILLKSF